VQKVTRREEIALFSKNFFRHPKMLGSLIPSSRFLIQRLMGEIDWDNASVIVEYGPGIGNITGEILRRMRPDARMIVLEMNEDFVRFLKRRFTDPRVHIVHGSAADVDKVLAEQGLSRAALVISGIPLSTIPAEVRQDILVKTRNALHPDGAFLVYQFSPKVAQDLDRIFSSVDRSFEPLNVPPAQIYYCAP
jgi:phospholipid N-methyltransferase